MKGKDIIEWINRNQLIDETWDDASDGITFHTQLWFDFTKGVAVHDLYMFPDDAERIEVPLEDVYGELKAMTAKILFAGEGYEKAAEYLAPGDWIYPKEDE